MKTFKQFQEQIKTGGTIKKPTVIMPDGKELPGLGGGGGGTNAITAKAKTKTFKNYVKDAIKIATFPISRRNIKPDPTEKFATEGAMAIPAAAGVVSKVLPAAVATYGAVKTIKDTLPTFMQIKNPKRSVYTGTRKSQKKERIPNKSSQKTNEVAKDLGLDLTDPRQRRKAQSRAVARGLKKKNKTNKKINTKTDDVVKSRYTTKDKTIRFEPKEGEVKKSQEMIDKLNNPNYFDKIMRNIRKEEAMAVPTNNASGGEIAGLPPDSPPVKRKKKTYAYGGRGSRKMWMNNK